SLSGPSNQAAALDEGRRSGPGFVPAIVEWFRSVLGGWAQASCSGQSLRGPFHSTGKRSRGESPPPGATGGGGCGSGRKSCSPAWAWGGGMGREGTGVVAGFELAGLLRRSGETQQHLVGCRRSRDRTFLATRVPADAAV